MFGRILIILSAVVFGLLVILSMLPKPEQEPTTKTAAEEINTEYEHEEPLPKSIMHYPTAQEMAAQKQTIKCYTGGDLQAFMHQRSDGNGTEIVMRGQLENNETMEIHRLQDGRFFVMVSGPDGTGINESCEVANGLSLQLATP